MAVAVVEAAATEDSWRLNRLRSCYLEREHLPASGAVQTTGGTRYSQ